MNYQIGIATSQDIVFQINLPHGYVYKGDERISVQGLNHTLEFVWKSIIYSYYIQNGPMYMALLYVTYLYGVIY